MENAVLWCEDLEDLVPTVGNSPFFHDIGDGDLAFVVASSRPTKQGGEYESARVLFIGPHAQEKAEDWLDWLNDPQGIDYREHIVEKDVVEAINACFHRSPEDRLNVIKKEMAELKGFDFESNHSQADTLLCKALEILGYNDLVKAYNLVRKY